ncbi:hypothetical protein T4B_498 [Trichinella pseudospiralis]|uniref:Uncharacterized protein n=1 Tax=Trichinella pseudospiralis TaxID=6337 RepID=A0A0V1IHN2_TRIPS|nr:hypothetical protein T4B_498 [Trichinella pseudospiralis]KRZ30291.1 hypothetical protein T4C_6749 [Trichinella pseudospiralis]
MADRYIRDLFQGSEMEKITKKIERKFVCECSGYWEKLVRCVETSIQKVLCKTLVLKQSFYPGRPCDTEHAST